ncbi:MAG: hypothetical protein AAFQ06_09260 [Pseudomonadota bacterium]
MKAQAFEAVAKDMEHARLAVLPTRHISLTDATSEALDVVTAFLKGREARAETEAAAS